MFAKTSVLGAAVLFGNFVASMSGPVQNGSTYEIRNLGHLTWVGPAFPGGENVNVTGTVPEIVEQLKAMNPNFEPPKTQTTERSTNPPVKVLCNDYGSISFAALQNGITYLDSLGGGLACNGPGPGNCGRISCSYNTAIWWCNDNPSDHCVLWSDLSRRALYNYDDCDNGGVMKRWILPPVSGQLTGQSGQTFYPDNTNVITSENNC